ncbi:ABC transporter ATP-binding protein [Micromonospora sp. NPDC048935]|uniref:ABC transporter ATP-binding protein n=1 Tax=Micromonospora sp. NPDC048935 TaxID=3364262 RepID=UPI003710D56A
MTTDTVTLTGLRAVYGTGTRRVTALDGVSTSFASGTFTAVMGPSGSGKSTLLHCAAGLDSPTEGTVTIDGTRLNDLGDNELTRLRRDRIGFVFQAFNLVTTLTAAQNVELPLRLAGRRPPAEDVTAALDAVGLADRAGHRPSELSGGEQQRVAVARALITRPAVVFADEPTGALDSAASRQVLRLLRGLVDDHGQTVVMVTHDPTAAAYADRVLLLADGRVVDELTGGITAAAVAARIAVREADPAGASRHAATLAGPSC